MARLWMTGFETGSATTGIEWTDALSGTASVVSTTKRTGTYALRTNPSGSTGYIPQHIHNSSSSGSHYFRGYIYVATRPSAQCRLVQFGSSSSPATGGIYMNTDGTMIVKDNFGNAGTGTSAAVPLNTWTRIELSQNNTGAPYYTGYVDGTQFSSGGTFGTSINWVLFGILDSVTADIYWDDIAVNDTSGSSQTGLPGAGAIVHLLPNAAGDNNAWFKSGGGAGDSNNYTQVSELLPDDATTYLKVTATSDNGKIDDYNVASSSSAGIGASDTINLVAVRGRAKFGQSQQSWAFLQFRIKASSGGTVTTSPNANAFFAQSSGVWVTFNTSTSAGADDIGNEHLVSYVQPGSTAWTPSAIDSMQIGVIAGIATFNSETDFSQLYAMVEYVAAAGAAFIARPGLNIQQTINRANTY